MHTIQRAKSEFSGPKQNNKHSNQRVQGKFENLAMFEKVEACLTHDASIFMTAWSLFFIIFSVF